MIRTFYEISTANLQRETMEALENGAFWRTVWDSPYGMFLAVRDSEEEDRDDGLPEDLIAAFALARESGADFLHADRDATPAEMLPIYNW